MSRDSSKPFIEPYKGHMTGLRILTIYMKAMNIINYK